MNPTVDACATAAMLPRPPSLFDETWHALRSLARRVEAWREAHRRAAADREALAGMSDRELLDIGIPRGSVSAVADRTWLRDYPR
jgi:uncharacterized protein YjiS (DUF1127 family)